MSDEEYQKRIVDLQKYLPFLENTIKRLKREEGKLRESQITKLQSLLDFLKNTKEKKLKLDVLRKCEEVILKIYGKKPPLETMYKYMCRNPPDDNKYIYGGRLNSDDVFSDDQQKLSSNSPPEKSLLSKPDVIPSEKIQNNRRYSFTDQNEYEFENPSSSNNENYSENQILNCSFSDFTPKFPEIPIQNPLFASQSSNWKIPTYEINPRQELENSKFNICSNKESDLTKDTFEDNFSRKLENLTPVSASENKFQQNRIDREHVFSNKESKLTKDTFERDFSLKMEDPTPVLSPENKFQQNLINNEYIYSNKESKLTIDISNIITPQFPENIPNPLHSSQNSSWKSPTYEINPRQNLENIFNICCNKESKLTKDSFEDDFSRKLENPTAVLSPENKFQQNRINKESELTKDNFEDDISRKLEDPKPVPPLKVKQNRLERKDLEKRKKLLKSSTPSKLNKPPLSKSELQEFVSSTTNDNSVSLVNKNLDNFIESEAKLCTKVKDQHKVNKPLPSTISESSYSLESDNLDNSLELKAKLCTKLEDHQKGAKSLQVQTPKPKQTSKVVERVIKEQKDLFGMLLSNIDEQIMNKKDQKKNEKKELKTCKDVKKDNKSDKNKKDIEIKHKKNETTVNENDIYKEKKNIKHGSERSKHNIKHKEYDKNETKIKESDLKNKDFESKSKNKDLIYKGRELKHQVNESKSRDDKKNKARKSEEYESEIKEIISKLMSPNKDIKSTDNNPKNKVEKSTKIKKVDKSRRSSSKEEKQKTDKTIVIDKSTILPTQQQNNSNSHNQNQFRRKNDEIEIDPDKFYSNQDLYQHKDQLRRHSDEFRANLKFLNQDYHQSQPQEQTNIDLYENEDKNRKDDFVCQRTPKDRGSLMTGDEKNKRESPEEGRKFPNKDKHKDGIRSRLLERFYREEKKFPANKKNHLRRFEEKRTTSNENYGNHRKRRSIEKKDEKPNIEPKEEIPSSADTQLAKPVVVKDSTIQNFRIPKICKSEIEEEKKDEFGERKSKENKVEDIAEESKIGLEESKEDIVKVKDDPSTSKEIAEIPKTETEEKINMFNTFMKHIFGSCDSSFLLEYLDKCGKPVPESKTKRVHRIINSDSETEEEIPKEKVKIEETPEIKEIEQQVSDKLQLQEEEKNVEKPFVTNEENTVKEKSVRKIFKKRSPLELLLEDFKTINNGSFAETVDQNHDQEVYNILNNSQNKDKDGEQEETLDKEDNNEENPSENFPRRRLRSLSRNFVEKINYTDISSNEENAADDKEKEIEIEETIINEITVEKSKIPRSRLRSLSRSFAEKNSFSSNKFSNEENSADGKEKEETEIKENTSFKSKFPQRRSRSVSRKFVEKINSPIINISNEENLDENQKQKEEKEEIISEITSKKSKSLQRRSRSSLGRFIKKIDIPTGKSLNEKNSADGEEEKKEETISVTNEIKIENNSRQRRLKSVPRSFPEKINIFMDTPSNEENFADEKQNEISENSKFTQRRSRSLSRNFIGKINTLNEENCAREKEEISEETMSIINEIQLENSGLPRRRLRSFSRSFIKSSEETQTADEKEEKKEEMMSLESTTFVEVKLDKKKCGPKLQKQIMVSETTKTETNNFETAKKRRRVKMRRTNWANGIIKENRKKKKVDRTKLSLSLSTETSKPSLAENFNENIEIETAPQTLQSQISDDEEYALFKIDSKQDIHYFLNNGNSFDCKLCDFKGKSIVSHYRTRHPESENLISRFSPEEAERAQIESQMNNFDEIEPFDEIKNGKKRKTRFVCRFCKMAMTTEISTFVDHVCCHTGEYRYSCKLCPFITGYKPNLFIHCYKTHPELTTPLTFTHNWSCPPNFRIMFGYLCKTCNFTQILRKNVQTHINVSHLGQNIEIIKISMSSESVNLDDLLMTRNVDTKMKEIEKILPPEQLENHQIDLQSKEIKNENFLKDFSPQISLAETETENDESPKDDTISTYSLDSSENENEDSQNLDKTIKLSNAEHSISTDSIQKELAANLPENRDNRSVPLFEQITDQEEKLKNTELNINVGAIEVQIRNKDHNYICKVPNCSFTSLQKINFIQHCNDIHSKITVLCEICAKENPYNYFTMISLFNHLFDVHKTNITKPEIVKTPEIDPVENIELSQPDMNFLQIKTSEIDAEPQPTIEKIDLNPEPSPDMGFLQIKDIRTLTEEEEQNLQLNLQLVQNSQIPPKNLSPANETKCKKQPTENVGYKTKKIFNEMLQYRKILHLYKCPIDVCSFSSSSQKDFKTHITYRHKCQIFLCVYCQKGIKSENFVKHIKSVHSHCTLQCAFCFYRTVSKKYLACHQKSVHKQSYNTLSEGLFYHLDPGNITEFVCDTPPRNMIIFPYKCNQDDCVQQFLIADDFMMHLRIYHKRNFICAICNDPTVYYANAQNLIQHYVKHNIARYQCQNCIFGTNDIDTLFMHYAQKHQHLEPICYVRQKKDENVSPKTLDDIILMNMESKQILEPKLITEHSTTKQNISISSPTITSTIPEDHNYTRTFVEKSPISKNLENLKIINIEPNNAVENSVDSLSIENKLHKCESPNCTYTTKILNDFRMHLVFCNALSNTYFCGHCDTKFTSVVNLRNHIEIHGKNKFMCGICQYKSSLEQVVKHMKDFHDIKTTKFNPVSLKKNMDKDYFIVEAINEPEMKKETRKSVLKSILENDTFPKENVLDPEDSGFDLTVNPDPSLKNDLATSSHLDRMAEEAKKETDKENKDDKLYPEFISVNKRFICGVLNCNYLTHKVQMFNHHLATLHANETIYKCPHCQIDISSNITGLETDKILCHLQMHDSHLYKCPNCKFFHHQKHKIEKHISENHPDTDKNIVVIREPDNSLNQNHADEKVQCEPDIETLYYNEEQIDNTKEITTPLKKIIHEESSDSESDTSREDISNAPLNFRCKHCDFVGETIKTLRKHERSHYMDYSYNCNCCNYAQQVKSHNKTKLSLKRKRSLIEENLEATEMIDKEIYYGCLVCQKKSNELEEIRSHFSKTHLKKGGSFIYKKVIMDKNTTRHYKCNYCELFADEKTLKQHCAEVHDEIWIPLRNTKLKCTICSQKYRNLRLIKEHFNKKHSIENISFHTLLEDGFVLNKTEFFEEKQFFFICIYCSDQFENKTELFNHHSLLHSHLEFEENFKKETEEIKKFKCPNCPHSSNNYHAIKKHLMMHYKLKPLICSHCNYSFIYPYVLKKHHLRKHENLPLIINKAPEFNNQMRKITATILQLNKNGTYSAKKNNTPFQCSHCHLSFGYLPRLKNHHIQKHPDLPAPEFTNEEETYSRKKLKRPHDNSDVDGPPAKILVLENKTLEKDKNLEYSFYGTKPCNITDYKNVMSEIDIMGKVMRINVVAMSHILNLSPKVQLVDMKNRIPF